MLILPNIPLTPFHIQLWKTKHFTKYSLVRPCRGLEGFGIPEEIAVDVTTEQGIIQ